VAGYDSVPRRPALRETVFWAWFSPWRLALATRTRSGLASSPCRRHPLRSARWDCVSARLP